MFGAALSALLIAIGIVAMPFLLNNQAEEIVRLSKILLIGIPMTLFGEFTANLLRAKLRINAFNAQRTIVPCGYLAVTFMLSITDTLSIRAIVIAQLALYLLRLCVSVILCFNSEIRLGWSFDWKFTKTMFTYSSKSHMGSAAEYVNSRFDQALIAAWLAPAQLGLYTVAVSAASLVMTTSQALKITVLPLLASETNHKLQDHMLVRIFRTYFSASIVMAPVYALGLFWIIPIIYGQSFTSAALPAAILVFGAIVFGAKDILTVCARALGQPWLGSKAELIATVITIILLVITLPIIGIVGVFVALGLARTRNIPIASLFTLDWQIWNARKLLIGRHSTPP
jgi:O-antigen/teichoic acid export membrane protein